MNQLKNKISRTFLLLLLILLIVTSGYIFVYYLLADTITELRSLPPFLIVAIVLYLLVQLLKRVLLKKRSWHLWIYGLGIIAILLPLPLYAVQNSWIFVVTQIGSLLLFFLPLIELIIFINNRQKKDNFIENNTQPTEQNH